MDAYNVYKPLALRHNEIYKKLVKERDILEEDEDIKEAKKLVKDHTVYSQEFKVSFKLMKELVTNYVVVSWQEERSEIISWDRWMDTCHVM